MPVVCLEAMASAVLNGVMQRRFLYLIAAMMMMAGTIAAAAPRVTVIEDAPWSPNDPSREGAAEFGIMLRIAKLQTDSSAIGMFGHRWDPQYYVNPPAYTYVLHIVFGLWFGGRDGVYHAYATDPGSVFAAARIVAAVLGTIAVWLLYLAGTGLYVSEKGARPRALGSGLIAAAWL